jgi:uncharacterized protein (DUF1015 family)
LATAEHSLLAVQHPQRTPGALAAGLSLADAMPAAVAELDSLCRNAYRPVHQVVAPYRISGEDASAVGILCLVDPRAVDEQGRTWVRDSERVYPSVVAERAEVLAALGVATSAAMLVPVADRPAMPDALSELVEHTCAGLGTPEVSAVDRQGRRHELWTLGPGAEQDALLAEAGRYPLLVADGNHRVAAARASGLGGLLALITAGPRLRVKAIHRVLVRSGLRLDDLRRAWASYPIADVPSDRRPETGTVVAVTDEGALAVRLPEAGGPDHAVLENVLLRKALGVDPQGSVLHAWPDGAPQVDGADVRLMVAPVPFETVRAMHRTGRRMHRKSTYFTPKPRSGLLLASLTE